MKEVLTKNLLTFVLLVVLVWHTSINPVSTVTTIKGRGAQLPDDEQHDREPDEQRELTKVNGGRSLAQLTPVDDGMASVDDLDWPEIIGEEEW